MKCGLMLAAHPPTMQSEKMHKIPTMMHLYFSRHRLTKDLKMKNCIFLRKYRSRFLSVLTRTLYKTIGTGCEKYQSQWDITLISTHTKPHTRLLHQIKGCPQ